MRRVNILFVLAYMILFTRSFSQEVRRSDGGSIGVPKTDSAKKDFYLKGVVTITNKGISYIPNFSLGKPAIMFDLNLGNGKLFFEPQLRFALTSEPWAFLFPVRYKINPKGKFQISTGVNPLMNFKNLTYTVNGVSKTDLVNRRYLGGEFRPSYFFTKSFSIGANYLYFLGVSTGAVQHTHFVSVTANFTEVKFGKMFFAKLHTQFYYLDQGGLEGIYFNPAITLLRRKFPFSIQSIANITINSNIPGSEDLLWNVSLIYSISKAYTPK
jgi:hypothetical protein